MQNLAPKIKAIQQRYAGNQVFLYFGISNQILQDDLRNFLVKVNYNTRVVPVTALSVANYFYGTVKLLFLHRMFHIL
jgi:membrane protein insertase Oxa1/YidC/SpoIIIJ